MAQTFVITQLPATVNVTMIEHDDLTIEFGPTSIGGETIDLTEYKIVTEVAGVHGVLLQPELEVYGEDNDSFRIHFHNTDTSMLGPGTFAWGIAWQDPTGEILTVVSGTLTLRKRVVNVG